VRVLALIHEVGPCSGVFAEAAAERGDEVEEWSPAYGTPPARPLEDYDAIWLFGGVANTHEEDDYPWLRDENVLIQELLARGVPMLGICLGGQLIAKAAGAAVHRTSRPEIGFHELRLTPEAASDPVLGGLPERMLALQWHYYRFDLPTGAVLLAENDVCPQAYRLGDVVWGLQFHAETTRDDWLRWVAEWEAIPDADRTGFDPDRLREETELHMARWNDIGREIASRFLAVAEASPDDARNVDASLRAAPSGSAGLGRPLSR
jgi:GMP synthase-like glutamine amidotransferase